MVVTSSNMNAMSSNTVSKADITVGRLITT